MVQLASLSGPAFHLSPFCKQFAILHSPFIHKSLRDHQIIWNNALWTSRSFEESSRTANLHFLSKTVAIIKVDDYQRGIERLKIKLLIDVTNRLITKRAFHLVSITFRFSRTEMLFFKAKRSYQKSFFRTNHTSRKKGKRVYSSCFEQIVEFRSDLVRGV